MADPYRAVRDLEKYEEKQAMTAPWKPTPGRSPDHPLPTLEWPGPDKPASWWGRDGQGQLTKVYRSYSDYCDD